MLPAPVSIRGVGLQLWARPMLAAGWRLPLADLLHKHLFSLIHYTTKFLSCCVKHEMMFAGCSLLLAHGIFSKPRFPKQSAVKLDERRQKTSSYVHKPPRCFTP